MGLYIVLVCKTTGLNLSQCSRPDTHILISVTMTVGNKSNEYACVGLIHFGRRCSLHVRRCVLSGDANNLRGYFLFLAHPHPVILLKSRGGVMFSEIYVVL